MENIFIDTCIYQEGQFIASGKLKTLFDAAKEQRICILLPDITEREVLAHIEEQLNAEHEKLKSRATSMLKHLEPLRKMLEEAVKLSETAANNMKEQFLEQLYIARVCRIPLQENLDLKAIVEAYFRKKPPFSQKKKSEFPDAIVLKSLETWCKENNEATTKIVVNHPDYDTAYYDGEDKQWYFVNDDVETRMTSELEFDIEFTTYQDGEDPELESINSGRHLSSIELHNSLSYGSFWME